MSHIEAAVRGSKKIEALLRDGFGVNGRGLHEYLDKVQLRVPGEIIRKARYIASVRNKVVHHEEEIFDLNDFNRSVEEVISSLNEVLEKERIARERREKEAQERLKRNTAAQSDPLPESGEKTGLMSLFFSSRFLMLIAVGFAFYFWSQLESEKYNRVEDGKEYAQQVADLQQQIKNEKLEREEEKERYKEERKKFKEEIVELSKIIDQAEQKNSGARKEKSTAQLKTPQTQKSKTAQFNDSLPSDNVGGATQKAASVAKTTSKKSLLSKARSSTSEYEIARHEVSNDFTQAIKEQIKITLGDADVSEEAGGTYSVRVPVSWSIEEHEVLPLLNRHFNARDGKPLNLSSYNKRLVIEKWDVESSNAVKPYSGRLFELLQQIEMHIEVALGQKSASIVIAGNGRCHVVCRYNRYKSTAWLMQLAGVPGGQTLDYKQETPVVIKGLTESDLKNEELRASIIQSRVR